MLTRRHYPPRRPPSTLWKLFGLLVILASLGLGAIVKIWWVHHIDEQILNPTPQEKSKQQLDEADRLNRAIGMPGK